MSNCELTQLFKVPLKSCDNSVLEHNLVTISLSVEWAEGGGDDPILVIEVTKKQPPAPYFQQNQPSVLVNSIHHQHQHQQNLSPTFQQQQHYQTSGKILYDRLSSTPANFTADHNDVSSMRASTTVVYNSLQPQYQQAPSSSEIEKIKKIEIIKSELQSQFPSHYLQQPPPKPSYLPPQQIIRTPSYNPNDLRLNIKTVTTSLASSKNQKPPVTPSCLDPNQLSNVTCPSSTVNHSPRRSLICNCPSPTLHHTHSCPAHPSNNSDSPTHFPFETPPRSSMNRINTPLGISPPSAVPTNAICMSSTRDPMITTSYAPFTNGNPMKTPSASPTIIPPPSTFLHNTPMYPINSIPSMNGPNNFLPQILNPPQALINCQPNYPSTTMSTFAPQFPTLNRPRSHRKRSIRQKNPIDPVQNLNVIQQSHSLTNQISPNQQQNPANFQSGPIQPQREMPMLQNNLPVTSNTLLVTTNGSKDPAIQHSSSPTTSNVRSPVEIATFRSKTINRTSPELDQTISMVPRRKEDIPLHHSSSILSQQRSAQSVLSRLVDEPNELIRTTKIVATLLPQNQQSSTYTSTTATSPWENIVHKSQPNVHPNPMEQTQVNPLPGTNDSNKRTQLTSPNNSKSKRRIKSNTVPSEATSISRFYQDPWQGKPSFVTSTSNTDSDPFSCPTGLSVEQAIPYSLDNSLLKADVPHKSNMLDGPVLNTDPIRILQQSTQSHPIHLYEFGSPKFDPLTSSTTTEQLMCSVSIENSFNPSLTPVANSTDIYDTYLPPEFLPSSSQWDDNQVTTTVTSPRDSQNNYLLEQQFYSQTDTNDNSSFQLQAPTSSPSKRNSTHSMNDSDAVHTSPNQETKSSEKEIPPPSNSRKNRSLKSSSKFSTQGNRSNPIERKSSTKPTCTRCGYTRLIDITQHEFPKQKGLVFECVSCGNSSIRSNVSADERKRRLAKVAADHLNKIECTFCQRLFHAHNDYIVHLRDDHQSNKPILSLSEIVFMNLTVGQIVWARRQKDDIYWPGRITIISNNSNEFWLTEFHYNYLVQFFVTSQSIWTTDILPYRQYRESMTNDSFMHYGLPATMKQDFLNAVYQADYTSSNEMYANDNDLTSMTTTMGVQQQNSVAMIEDNTDNDCLLTPAPMFTTNTESYNPSNQTIQPLELFPISIEKTSEVSTTHTDWYTQQGLIVESITPPVPFQNDAQPEYVSSSDHFHQTNSVIIITTKTYTSSSFISYLFNCFSHFSHHSIIYLDDPIINYQHPPTSNISYLICLDHFDSTIKHVLNSTILNNLTAHVTYLFLLLNAPSHELVKHFYSTVMDRRTIVVLHYHSTFENEPLLLCSGSRTTYEMIRWTLLKYLCSKIKFIESEGDEQLYSAYCISSMIQSSNVLNHFVHGQIQEILNENFDRNFLGNNQETINELFPQLSITRSATQSNLLDFVHQSNADLLQNRAKQSTIVNDLLKNGAIRTQIPPPICEYYLEHVLHEE